MAELEKAKSELHSRLHQIAEGADAGIAYHPGADWWGSHPLNELKGIEAISNVWSRVRAAMPDLERRDSIFIAGYSVSDTRPKRDPSGDLIVTSMGHFQGTFRRDLLGIPATSGVVHLRCCEAHRVVHGKIDRSYVLFDFLDLMRQAGRVAGLQRHWGRSACGRVRRAVAASDLTSRGKMLAGNPSRRFLPCIRPCSSSMGTASSQCRTAITGLGSFSGTGRQGSESPAGWKAFARTTRFRF